MIGAICGDILGSHYEFGIVDDVYLKHEDDDYTDDTVLTCAVAEWCCDFAGAPLLGDGEHQYVLAKFFHNYTMKDVMEHYATVTAQVTHNNPEGIRGACAIAVATKMALDGHNKEEIKDYIESHYYYDLSPSLDSAKSKQGEFSATCPVTVPQAIIAFLHGKDYRDTIEKAIAMDGDCDTVAAMAGSIAYAYWKEIPEDLLEHCFKRLNNEMLELWQRFKCEFLEK